MRKRTLGPIDTPMYFLYVFVESFFQGSSINDVNLNQEGEGCSKKILS